SFQSLTIVYGRLSVMCVRRRLCCLPMLLLASCESVQTTQGGDVGVNRSQYMFSGLSSAEVDQMAAESYQQMLDEARSENLLNTDTAMLRRLRRIADELVKE